MRKDSGLLWGHTARKGKAVARWSIPTRVSSGRLSITQKTNDEQPENLQDKQCRGRNDPPSMAANDGHPKAICSSKDAGNGEGRGT